MKAIICTSYGAPDVLQVKEVEKPAPRDNEVLIKIHAAVVTRADCSLRKANPFLVKLKYGFSKPKFGVLGVELSGEIEALGKDVKLFKEGDRVVGLSPKTFGAYAEYLCLPEDDLVVKKTDKISHEEAVGICDGATTALTFLRDKAQVQRGQKVLINGASGSVGAYAVQLARHFGAEVCGVCSTANVELVKSLGADTVIDYTRDDFTKAGHTYDVIFDAVGKSSFSRCKGALTPHGIYLTTVPSLAIVPQMLMTSKSSGKKAKLAFAGLEQSKENLDFLNALIVEGKIKPVIDRLYPLEQIAEAHRYVEMGHKKGNVVITMGHKD